MCVNLNSCTAAGATITVTSYASIFHDVTFFYVPAIPMHPTPPPLPYAVLPVLCTVLYCTVFRVVQALNRSIFVDDEIDEVMLHVPASVSLDECLA